MRSFAVVLGMILLLASCGETGPSEPNEPPPLDPVQQRLQEEFGAPPETAPWRYVTRTDEMRGTTTRTACTNAINRDGSIVTEPLAQFCVQILGDNSINAAVVSSEPFSCHDDRLSGCDVAAKVDAGSIVSWRADFPQTRSTYTTLVLLGADDVLTAVRGGRQLILELPYYHRGNEQLRFDISNLTWPPPAGDLQVEQ